MTNTALCVEREREREIWSTILQGRPDISVTSTEEPNLFILMHNIEWRKVGQSKEDAKKKNQKSQIGQLLLYLLGAQLSRLFITQPLSTWRLYISFVRLDSIHIIASGRADAVVSMNLKLRLLYILLLGFGSFSAAMAMVVDHIRQVFQQCKVSTSH